MSNSPLNASLSDNPRWPCEGLTLYRSINQVRTYYLAEILRFITDNKYVITLRPGLVTDGTSSPRMLWWYASPFAGAHAPAVVLHDGLYKAHFGESKDVCDDIFYQALLTLPMRPSKAWAMYTGVKTPAAQRAWNEKTDEQILEAVRHTEVVKQTELRGKG